MKKIWIIVLIVFILGLFVGFVIGGVNLTGETVREVEYSYTVAICNSQSECIDVLVECVGERVKSVELVSDLKDFSDLDDWEYPEVGGFCEGP